MGREIRRVPLDWQHPRDEEGHYLPLHDRPFTEAAAKWKQGFLLWEAGAHEDQQRHPDLTGGKEYWEWEGDPPEREKFREEWGDRDAVAYQVYETVSEGTPLSPVFEATEQMERWLVGQGHSQGAARRFAEVGHVWSAVITQAPGKPITVKTGIDSLDQGD